MPKKRNESGPCFTAWGTLTNTTFADFINGRFDEEKGVMPPMTIVLTIAKNDVGSKG